MEFGFSLPGRGPLAQPDNLVKITVTAEQLRYASIFVTDHVVLPASMASSVYPYSSDGRFPGGAEQDYLEPLVMMAYLARATSKIRLGTSVLVIPYRHPLLVAKMLATIDVLSRGRVILGAGVGWLREEFEALDSPSFDARGAVTDEAIDLMRRAWTLNPVSVDGRHYRVRDVFALPKPVQKGGIPIWIGGHTDAAVRRAGRLGDGWHPIALRPPGNLLPDEFATKMKLLHAAAREAGRDPGALVVSLRVPMAVRSSRTKPPAGDRPLFQGTAGEVAADIKAYAALGVSHFVFDPTVQDMKDVLANMRRFADDVRPLVARRTTARA